MAGEIVWENPPHTGGMGSSNIYAPLLAEVRTRPGRWARIRGPLKQKAAYGAATKLRRGELGGVDTPTDWEFAARTINGGGFVYARFIGQVA